MSAPAEVLAALAWKQHYRDQEEKAHWERARWVAYLLLQPHDMKRKLKKLADIVEFPWEKEPPKPETQEDREKRIRILRKLDALHAKETG